MAKSALTTLFDTQKDKKSSNMIKSCSESKRALFKCILPVSIAVFVTIYSHSRIFYINQDLSKPKILHLDYINVAKQVSKQDYSETHQHPNFQPYKY